MEEKKEFEPPVADFSFFATTLALQTSIALGQVPNPVNQEKAVDLNQAKFLIDTLTMLKDKTTGNLSTEEAQLLDNLLYELQMKYAEVAKGGANG